MVQPKVDSKLLHLMLTCVCNPDPRHEQRYAGFAFRREWVHKALALESLDLVGQLRTARPLHAAMLPDGAGVHEFEAKPSFSFAAAKSSADGIAYTMAMRKLRDPMFVRERHYPVTMTHHYDSSL